MHDADRATKSIAEVRSAGGAGSVSGRRWARALAYRQIAAAAGQVERLGAAVDRHPDGVVGARDQQLGRQAVRLGAEQPGRRQVEDAVGGRARRGRARRRRSVASTDRPARASSRRAGRRGRRRAADRQVEQAARRRRGSAFGLNGSTESPARITPSAPAASASRMTVPALPGSLGRDQHRDQPRASRPARRRPGQVGHARSGRRCPAGSPRRTAPRRPARSPG